MFRRFVGADSALSRNTLALLTTVIAFGVSAAFLLSLVPDAETSRRAAVGAGPAPASASATADLRRRHRCSAVAGADPAEVRAGRGVMASKRMAARATFRSGTSTPSAPTRITHSFTTATQEYFCNQSISMLEAGLDRGEFMRVHRSPSSGSIACRG